MKSIPVRQMTSDSMESNTIGRFKIRDIATMLKGSHLEQDLHRHNFYFILALEKAKGMHEIDFIGYEVKNHTIFVIRPGQVHKLHLKAGATGMIMEFDRQFYNPRNAPAEERWRRAASKNYCVPSSESFDALLRLLKDMLNEFTWRKPAFYDAIRAMLDLFFIAYLRQSEASVGMSNKNYPYHQEKFEAFFELIEKNVSNEKRVGEYAKRLNLSLYQLNAITRTAVNKTASQMITDQIILEGKRNLLATSKQVKAIADELGYEDISYFIRLFKKHTGDTPDAFRKKFK